MRKRIAEFRATIKALAEQRADLQVELQGVLDLVQAETRAFTDEEQTKFDTLEKQIKSIDATIGAEERARSLDIKKGEASKVTSKVEERAVLEEKVFANFIRGVASEQRADVNMTTSDNGSVIPASIANKIISKVVDICPIYQLATRYNVGGTLSIPYYDTETQTITMGYASEFATAESTSGKTTSIELKGFLATALTKISKSLVNNSSFDIVNFTIAAMAEAIASWIEKELLKGTTDKIAGLSGVTLSVVAASAVAITSDELIQLKDKVKDRFQGPAIWIMNSATRTALRLLKDTTGKYILNDDVTSPFGTTLLGKPVYVSDNMDVMASGKTAIFYGDMSGLAVKLSEDVSIEVLREVYATQHAIGVNAWIEIDSKVENAQKISKLVMKTV